MAELEGCTIVDSESSGAVVVWARVAAFWRAPKIGVEELAREREGGGDGRRT